MYRRTLEFLKARSLPVPIWLSQPFDSAPKAIEFFLGAKARVSDAEFAAQRKIMKRTAILTLLFLFAFCSSAQAQDRQKRREFLQDLLKGLIESEIGNGNQPRVQPGQPNPGRPANPNFGRPPIAVEVSQDMLRARQSLSQWNTAAANLVGELRHHEQEAPQLRPILADAMRFQASVGGLSRRAQLTPTLQPLTGDFAELDRNWRLISNKIKSTRGIPADCAGFVTTINDLDAQLSGLFNIEPTVDRMELSRLATTMTNDFDHLLRGVFYSVRDQRGGNDLIRDGQQLQAKIGQAASLVNRGSYQSMVNAFGSCVTDWRKFSSQVMKLRDERLRYSIQRIEDTGRQIKQQLFLPIELDRGYLVSTTEALAAECNQIFRSITLADMLNHKNPQKVMRQCRSFSDACIDLGQKLDSDESEKQLEWSYRSFSKKWEALNQQLHELQMPAVSRQLENMSATVASIGSSLNAETTLSHDELVHLFSELDAVYRQAAFDAHQFISEKRYGSPFSDQMCGGFDQLQRTAYDLHRQSINPAFRVQPNALTPMFEQWTTLRPLLANCKGADKRRFADLRQQIEPMMVKLQILYGG